MIYVNYITIKILYFIDQIVYSNGTILKSTKRYTLTFSSPKFSTKTTTLNNFLLVFSGIY